MVNRVNQNTYILIITNRSNPINLDNQMFQVWKYNNLAFSIHAWGKVLGKCGFVFRGIDFCEILPYLP